MSTEKTKPAVQLVLGSQVITFPLPITVNKLDGTDAQVTFTCKAMRKTAWAKLRDDYHTTMLRASASRTEEVDSRPTDVDSLVAAVSNNGMHSLVERGLQTDAELVLQFATAWDLADDLTADSLAALEDEFGGTLAKAIRAYEAAIYQGRLGN